MTDPVQSGPARPDPAQHDTARTVATRAGPALEVAASLWSVPPADRPTTARRLVDAGLRRWHWDVSDGVFAAPGGFTPGQAADLTAHAPAPGEAHLMVTDPLPVVDDWVPFCDLVVVHVESRRCAEAVDRIRSAGTRAGVAIGPDTPLDALDALPADLPVLVMAITPGQAGSRFSPATLDRLTALSGRPASAVPRAAAAAGHPTGRPHRRLLGVDGGVDLARAHDCARHGATWVVSGTALCAAPDPAGWLSRAEHP